MKGSFIRIRVSLFFSVLKSDATICPSPDALFD